MYSNNFHFPLILPKPIVYKPRYAVKCCLLIMSERRKFFRRNTNVKFILFSLTFFYWLQNLATNRTKMLTKGALPEIKKFSSNLIPVET